jgi:hypothetical protein
MSFMMHPSRQNRVSNTAVTKGLGINQTAVNPVWESKSYSKNINHFNSGNRCNRGGSFAATSRACK